MPKAQHDASAGVYGSEWIASHSSLARKVRPTWSYQVDNCQLSLLTSSATSGDPREIASKRLSIRPRRHLGVLTTFPTTSSLSATSDPLDPPNAYPSDINRNEQTSIPSIGYPSYRRDPGKRPPPESRRDAARSSAYYLFGIHPPPESSPLDPDIQHLLSHDAPLSRSMRIAPRSPSDREPRPHRFVDRVNPVMQS